MKNTKLLTILLLFVVSEPISSDSLRVMRPSSGHVYQRMDTRLTWNSARRYCDSVAGYLASITSSAENKFVFNNIGTVRDGIWLGGHDSKIEGVWQWITNEPWSYSNWGLNQPNNALRGQDFLLYHRINPGQWDDGGLPTRNAKHVFICEWNEVEPYENFFHRCESAKLLASDGEENDRFGRAISIDGHYLAIGAARDDDRGKDAGAVYLFKREVKGVWTQVAKIVAPDGQPGDQFGHRIALDGDRIVIGAYKNKVNGIESGSVYVFKSQMPGYWVQEAKISPSDGADGDGFGFRVAFSGSVIAVGSYLDDDLGPQSGSVYIYELDKYFGWQQVAKLLAGDGDANDRFGRAIGLDSHRLVIGAYFDKDLGYRSGSAYVFERNDLGDWVQSAKLLSPNGSSGDYFGRSVDIDNDTIIVGAWGADTAGNDSGEAHIFERDSNGIWSSTSRFLPFDASAGESFGYSVAIKGKVAVVGARYDNEFGYRSGAGYVFVNNSSGQWIAQTKLFASDASQRDQFGSRVAIDDGGVVIGAWRNDDLGLLSGSVYIFDPAVIIPKLSVQERSPILFCPQYYQ